MATFVGIDALGTRVLGQLQTLAGSENDLTRLGTSLSRLLALCRHDTLLGSARSEPVGTVIEAAYDRGLWLIESIGGLVGGDPGMLLAILAIRDALRFVGKARGLSLARARGVMERRSVDVEAPPSLRGAALGFLWSMGNFVSTSDAESHAIVALKKASQPEQLGDWLVGLLALAREEVLQGEERDEADLELAQHLSLLGILDATIAEMDQESYLIALPSLRLALSYFPPREKERVASRVLTLHGKENLSPRTLTRLAVDASTLVEAQELEARVDAREQKFGLHPRESHRE